MVRSINVAFEDKEIEKLEEIKKKMSWHDFILKLLEEKEEKKR